MKGREELLITAGVLVTGLMACTADGDDEPGPSVQSSQQSPAQSFL